jgi:hypothetical protein
MTQGVLPFQYEVSATACGMTALAGLPAYLDLAAVSGLTGAIRRHLSVSGAGQGWTDEQVVMSLVLLNLAGGDCVNDLRVLEADEGFVRVLRRVELYGRKRKERRALERRWRKERRRAVPSPSAVFRYLGAFHDAEEEAKRVEGKAFIPAPTEALKALYRINRELLAFKQAKAPQKTATLDMDATLVETYKRLALFCYQGYAAYQPLPLLWQEQGMVLHSEFRDGLCARCGYEPVRVLTESLQALPKGVQKVCLRTDTAGYDHKLLQFCAEGRSDFGVIEFAIGVDVTAAFKAAVAEVSEWQPLSREIEGRREPSGQEWAEVCFVPSWAATKKSGPQYRFFAIREPLAQVELPGMEPAQLPFPTMRFEGSRYKVFGVVTNRTAPGEEVIHWHRERCGKGEEVHAVMKNDLAGGQMPSGLFGVNAAWWAIVVLALNLNALMTHLVLPEGWAHKRLKALRFALIGVAGRVLGHARRLIVRLAEGHPASALLIEVRSRILGLAPVPTG